MTAYSLPLEKIAWPASRLGELTENLARRARLISHPNRISQPDASFSFSSEIEIGRWIDNAAGYLELEAEPISTLYSDVEQLLKVGGPAILRLPGMLTKDTPSFIGLIRASGRRIKILSPDLRVKKIKLNDLRSALCLPYEAQYIDTINQILDDAQVPSERIQRAQQAILREQLGPIRIEAGWLLRIPPSAKMRNQIRHAGIYRPSIILYIMYFIQQLLRIASWIVIGRGIFQGHFDLAWVLAWAILLLATIPLQIIVNDSQSELSMGTGALFKGRLIQGTLKLEPEEIRHQGIGQFLGRVMDSEAVEMLVLGGGFGAVLSLIEIGIAIFILSHGAGGYPQSLSLVVWVLITLIILWRYYLTSRDWYTTYREMTNDLVERMVGHRTRLIQEDPDHWHDDEDQSLDRYIKLSENMDQIGILLNAVVSRGWMIVGLVGIAIPFITSTPTAASLAISLGGVLLSSQALGQLAGGAQSLISLLNTWHQVGPLFTAASRPREQMALGFSPPTTFETSLVEADDLQVVSKRPESQTILEGRDLNFRYRSQGNPVIRGCSLKIDQGDRVLLEGPSGGGKSTLASLLTGLRKPESGTLLLMGYDRQLLGTEEWRRRVVMAPQFQENYVFSETFSFNLLMGRRWPPQPEDLEEAEAICQELGLGDLLNRMPSGFQQMLGESGWQLSHGERSRLFIARTLLQKADLIILDESFGALDPENLLRSIQCVLNRAATVMVIAHP